MARDDDIEAIVEIGRRTRMPTPRWLWIAAAIVGVICATGFTIALLDDHEPASHGSEARSELAGGKDPADPARPGRPGRPGRPVGSGLGTGLVIGVAVGIVIGVAIGRQRSHSSRSSP